MVKVIDPPWYKPVVSKVVASTSISKIDELQRQEAQVSVPTPRDDKSTKVFSSTRVKRLLDLNMGEMMPSLGSSFSTTDLADLKMRLSLLLM